MNLKQLLFLNAAGVGGTIVEETVTGNPVKFETNKAKPLTKLLCAWTPMQSGTGDPAPSNVRPISGMDGISFLHCGENLLNMTFPSKTSGGITYTNNGDGSLTLDGTCTSFNPQSFVFDVDLPAGTYSLKLNNDKAKTGSGNAFFGLHNTDGSDFGTNFGTVGSSAVVRTNAPIHNVYINIFSGAVFDNVTIRPMLTVGSYADFVPYTGTTYAVEFPALGKNLCGNEIEQGTIIGATGVEAYSDARVRIKGYIPLTEGEYTISAVGVDYVFYYSYKEDGTYMQSESNGFVQLPRKIIVNGNRKYRFVFRKSDSSAEVSPSDVSNVMLNVGSTALPYEPYTNTVYGGTLDLTTGVLTAEWAKTVFDGTESWTANTHVGDMSMFTTTISDSVVVQNDDEKIRCKSNKFNGTTALKATRSQRALYDVAIISSNRAYFIVPDEIENSSQMKAWVSENNIDFVYELASPITYQLTPTQVTALIGNNTIWSDANGSNTVTYLKKE